MKKNVIAQGPSTLMISLPFKWVKKYGIKKGTQLELVEKGREIKLSTDSIDDEIKSKTVNLLDNHNYYVWTQISPYFIAGYDEIKIENFDSSSLDFIENDVIKSLMGFEIVEQNSEVIILRKVMGEDSSEFDTFMRRIFLGLIEQLKVLLEFFKTGKDLDSLLTFCLRNIRQILYLKRLLTKEGFIKQDKIVFASILMEYLFSMSNSFKYLMWTIQKEKFSDYNEKIIDDCNLLKEKLELVYKLYFSYSPELFEQIKNKTINLDTKSGNVIDDLDLNPKVMFQIASMIEHLRLISYQIHGINS